MLDLPVGEADPIVRLRRSLFTCATWNTERLVGARLGHCGLRASHLHALGARVGTTLSNRAYNIAITNVPGPQRPLYAAGSEMISAYPFSPLVQGQALGIGLTVSGVDVCGAYRRPRCLADVSVIIDGLADALSELKSRI